MITTTRARHEHQIKLLNSTFGREFDKALDRVIRRHGLPWFTDDQIADMRAEMIEREWSRHKLNRENRKFLAAIESRQTEETV